ncbi:endonuclease, partial [Bordetella avium]
MISLRLPWPPKELSPNFRGHWAPISRAKKSYRTAARLTAMKALRHAERFDR